LGGCKSAATHQPGLPAALEALIEDAIRSDPMTPLCWVSRSLRSRQVIVQLIAAPSTETGLAVCCDMDANLYPKGIKVSDEEMATIKIARDEFHGEWNYTISPNQQPL
jgi:hypothetical protein